MAKKKTASKARKSSSAPVEAAAEAAAHFEESLSEVERIVRELESSQLSLADSLRSYEQGVRALRLCHEHLEKVERRIEVLVGFDEEGRPVTESFETDSMTLEEKQAARGRRRGAGAKSSAAEDEGETEDDASGSRVDDSWGLF